MSDLERLKQTASRRDFARLLDIHPGALTYILYRLPEQEPLYTSFTIPKSSGGVRTIDAPHARLKRVQRSLANILNSCMQEIEAGSPGQILSHGFRKKTGKKSAGIHTNARCHRKQHYVLNLDLADFFPSFNFGRVYGFFIKDRHFTLCPKVARLIAQIACHQNRLPQGSPCSPVITNFIAYILDVRLVKIAKKYGWTYSRYADDITFSTGRKEHITKMARFSDKLNQWVVNEEIEHIIKQTGFKINPAKTRLQPRSSRQIVTGLVVNEKVNIKCEYYRYARSMCHRLFTKGDFFVPENGDLGSINQLEGILGHIYFIKKFSTPEEESRLKDVKADKPQGFLKLYCRFLHFRYFVSNERPLIMCEGKTDVTYLKVAIKQLKKKGYNFPYEVTFFPHTPRVEEIMSIDEGTNALKSFIAGYEKRLSFTQQPRKNPVIVLLDNDKEAKGVIQCLENKFPVEGTLYDRTQHFFYTTKHNLYVILLPVTSTENTKKDGNETIIEDLFDQSVRKEQWEGKVLSLKKKFDTNKYYGKKIFAENIVWGKQDSINFERFKPVLELLSQAIRHHEKHLPSSSSF